MVSESVPKDEILKEFTISGNTWNYKMRGIVVHLMAHLVAFCV